MWRMVELWKVVLILVFIMSAPAEDNATVNNLQIVHVVNQPSVCYGVNVPTIQVAQAIYVRESTVLNLFPNTTFLSIHNANPDTPPQRDNTNSNKYVKILPKRAKLNVEQPCVNILPAAESNVMQSSLLESELSEGEATSQAMIIGTNRKTKKPNVQLPNVSFPTAAAVCLSEPEPIAGPSTSGYNIYARPKNVGQSLLRKNANSYFKTTECTLENSNLNNITKKGKTKAQNLQFNTGSLTHGGHEVYVLPDKNADKNNTTNHHEATEWTLQSSTHKNITEKGKTKSQNKQVYTESLTLEDRDVFMSRNKNANKNNTNHYNTEGKNNRQINEQRAYLPSSGKNILKTSSKCLTDDVSTLALIEKIINNSNNEKTRLGITEEESTDDINDSKILSDQPVLTRYKQNLFKIQSEVNTASSPEVFKKSSKKGPMIKGTIRNESYGESSAKNIDVKSQPVKKKSQNLKTLYSGTQTNNDISIHPPINQRIQEDNDAIQLVQQEIGLNLLDLNKKDVEQVNVKKSYMNVASTSSKNQRAYHKGKPRSTVTSKTRRNNTSLLKKALLQDQNVATCSKFGMSQNNEGNSKTVSPDDSGDDYYEQYLKKHVFIPPKDTKSDSQILENGTYIKIPPTKKNPSDEVSIDMFDNMDLDVYNFEEEYNLDDYSDINDYFEDDEKLENFVMNELNTDTFLSPEDNIFDASHINENDMTDPGFVFKTPSTGLLPSQKEPNSKVDTNETIESKTIGEDFVFRKPSTKSYLLNQKITSAIDAYSTNEIFDKALKGSTTRELGHLSNEINTNWFFSYSANRSRQENQDARTTESYIDLTKKKKILLAFSAPFMETNQLAKRVPDVLVLGIKRIPNELPIYQKSSLQEERCKAIENMKRSGLTIVSNIGECKRSRQRCLLSSYLAVNKDGFQEFCNNHYVSEITRYRIGHRTLYLYSLTSNIPGIGTTVEATTHIGDDAHHVVLWVQPYWDCARNSHVYVEEINLARRKLQLYAWNKGVPIFSNRTEALAYVFRRIMDIL